ncbi:MAG TPA: hydrogenase maturation nickel metallochaperone HypA [Negativicutes bacterium]|nr:hydrogenase maturation nickel metallochaperone HypA [Negativicutes bacterium]
MHEYPITQQIVKLAVERAEESKAARITRISLVVGEMTGFVGDSIKMYFDAIAEGTMAEGAEISIRYVSSKLRCTSCGEYFERQKYTFRCPSCDGQGVPTDIGKEFHIEEIEVED